MKFISSTFYTYIVECSDGSYYTGKTSDLSHRIKQHNGLLSGGAKYTSRRRPVRLVLFEKYPTNQFACQREAEIKKLNRLQKERLIQTTKSKRENRSFAAGPGFEPR